MTWTATGGDGRTMFQRWLALPLLLDQGPPLKEDIAEAIVHVIVVVLLATRE